MNVGNIHLGNSKQWLRRWDYDDDGRKQRRVQQEASATSECGAKGLIDLSIGATLQK
jgi:hypothetical protein